MQQLWYQCAVGFGKKGFCHHLFYKENEKGFIVSLRNDGGDELFNVDEKRKLQLPAWTAGYYPDKLRTLAARSLALFSESQTMKRLNGGPLVKHIIEKIQSQSNTSRTVSPKFLMFSAHDVTIVNVLQTMGFTELLKPQYGAAVIIQLHSTNDSGYEVKVLYLNNASDSELHVLNTPGCTDKCHLQQFVDLMKPVLPDDWTVECQKLDS
ncbi:putative acid phosphatase 5 [Schistocerca serialis cubense]|uniref:putative acid phosphatase 5 n=1 Tax=Schistocerca serialis cubense TaxID=2023355 RepID=UPI00214EE8AC|nr:putative acid phosphatase 5 [Schistocerca serialis cubense]